ncbi:MAG: PQQ-dependent sugar dehydrogenase, partial [Methyloligellaceae bacterium]
MKSRTTTAIDGQDYVATSGTVLLDVNEDRVTLPVTILDDILSEPTENFIVSIISVDSGTLGFPRTARVDILDNENPANDPPDPPLVSDYDVTEDTLVQGLNQPLALEFVPQNPSLIYVATKGGDISVYDTGTGALVTNLVDLSAEVNSEIDRGLLDIAIHPDFVNNPYIYAFYVVDPPGTIGGDPDTAEGPDGFGNRFAHVVRFEADAGTGYTSLVPGSKTVLIGAAGQTLADISGGGTVDSTVDFTQTASDLDPADPSGFKQDYIKVDSTSHAGGALAFGPDGALYISVGDGTSFNAMDPRTTSVQDLNSLSGKILRVDPITGLGLADNPFVQPGDNLALNQSKVFQLGLRNPFSMGFDQNGQLILTSTGWGNWEEINSGPPGANFGWPYYEGGDNGALLPTTGYSGLPEAAVFY